MQKISFLLLLTLFPSLQSIALASDNDLHNLNRVIFFIDNYLIGHSLSRDYFGKISNGNIYTEFTSKKTFTDLKRSQRGLSFKVICSITQKNWDLDENGNKVNLDNPEIKDRIVTDVYLVSQRKSTGEVTGYIMTDANSIVDSTGTFGSLRVSVENADKDMPSLTIKSSTGLYGDYFDANGTYKPGSSDTVFTYYFKNNRLHCDSVSISYNVDPITLQRETKPCAEITSEEHED